MLDNVIHSWEDYYANGHCVAGSVGAAALRSGAKAPFLCLSRQYLQPEPIVGSVRPSTKLTLYDLPILTWRLSNKLSTNR